MEEQILEDLMVNQLGFQYLPKMQLFPAGLGAGASKEGMPTRLQIYITTHTDGGALNPLIP